MFCEARGRERPASVLQKNNKIMIAMFFDYLPERDASISESSFSSLQLRC